ncbi:MAG: hypothetical protein KTR31_06640 [Myxococcales bacterium]|nr:hypothetical protein [Myxococcales bacterium]
MRLRIRQDKRADIVVCAEVTAPARSAWARYLEVAVARHGSGDMVLIEPPPSLLGPSAAGSCGVGLAVRDGAVALTVVPLGDAGAEVTVTLTPQRASSLASWLAAPRAVAMPRGTPAPQ